MTERDEDDLRAQVASVRTSVNSVAAFLFAVCVHRGGE